MRTTSSSPSVAVVVPLYRDDLTPDEEISLLHLETHLGGYDRINFAPKSLRLRKAGFERVSFADEFFRSVHDYSRLLLSPSFYRTFASYEYILVYQLDCLVFSDDLPRWCDSGYDYVGAPWWVDADEPERGLSRVGNGGLSLRRVESFLDVLHPERPAPSWWKLPFAPLPDLEVLPAFSRWRKRARALREAHRGVTWYAGNYSLNEDHFWGDRARLFRPEFEIAPPEEALGFAFERWPRACFERRGRRLPFGCHAWPRWDRSFWEPHLLTPHGSH